MFTGLNDIVFLDIETVACTQHFDSLDERLKVQWARKARFIKKEDKQTDERLFELKAGIYAEFGKIISIALGYFSQSTPKKVDLRIKPLQNHNEKELLQEFRDLIVKFDASKVKLCAHNGKEFDFPYLSRRMLINGIQLPDALSLSGKKPWEVNHLDTMDMWKFGDWKHFTSLELLASIFNIESSKDDIDGSKVGHIYYVDDNLDKVSDYCAKDVAVTAQLYLKMKGIDLGNQLNIVYL